ncbi:tyrosine-type recombinase/integrase [Novosphingobium sp. ERW19]|nr:tyrosine-type recombinase/integrase [Novosphingobium sp. ERW19]
MGKLTTAKVRSAKAGTGANGKPVKATYQDGDGLFLICAPTGAKSWMLRVQVDGKRRDIGLGSLDVGAGRNAFAEGDKRLEETPLMLRKRLTLAEAREKAAALRKLAKAGSNPIAERDRERVKVPTFAKALEEAHEALKSGWADKTAKAFKTSLEEHALPKLGAMPVDVIGSAEVIAALAPIWTDKPEMARKVRSRIGQVLAFAKARGWRSDALPDARELRSGLSKQSKGKSFPAMPFGDVPAFFASELSKDATASRFAVLFVILTAARSGEVREATWEKVDLAARTWTRTAEDMKMRTGHVVTLSEASLSLLERWQPDEALRKGLIFPGARGRPLSDMSLSKALRSAHDAEVKAGRVGYLDPRNNKVATVHGFRSSFRDWAAERMPTMPAMVAEMALAHKVGNATEQAYLRSDLRDMRRALMDSWGRFAAPALSGLPANVTALPLQLEA